MVAYSTGPVVEAATFSNSLGVNTHLNYGGTPYADGTAVANALNYLGIHILRDVAGGQTTSPSYDALAAAGDKFEFVMPGQNQGVTGPLSLVSAFQASHPGSVIAIEGPNEVNNWGVTYNGQTGVAAALQYQHDLYADKQSTPDLAGVPLVDLSIAGYGPSSFQPYGDLSAVSDAGNAHIYYASGQQPANQLATALSWAQVMTPGKPMTLTETGYGTMASDSTLGVDLTTQAKLELNLIFDAAKAGVARTFLYELADDAYSGGGGWDYFGLFHADWTPKPAATAIHNLMQIVGSSSGAPGLEAAPQFAINGLNGSEMMIHKADGGYDLVLWSEPQNWDPAAHQEITVPAQSVTVQLSQPVGGYSIYDPLQGATAISSGNATSTISVSVTDHPIIIELHGAAPAGATTNGADGADTLSGANGTSNTISGGGGDDSITGGDAFNRINGNQGADTIVGHSSVGDWLLGGQGNDSIDASASSGHNIINGNLGADTLSGGAGPDTLRGGQVDDGIHAGSGRQGISGDLGTNTIYGGQGLDTFHAGAGHDVINGWHAGDHVQVDQGVTWAVSQVNADLHVSFSNGGEVDLVGVQQSALASDWIVH